jgi:hypothetical protein
MIFTVYSLRYGMVEDTVNKEINDLGGRVLDYTISITVFSYSL